MISVQISALARGEGWYGCHVVVEVAGWERVDNLLSKNCQS